MDALSISKGLAVWPVARFRRTAYCCMFRSLLLLSCLRSRSICRSWLQRLRHDVFRDGIELRLKLPLDGVIKARLGELSPQRDCLIAILEVGNQLKTLNDVIDRGLGAVLDLEESLQDRSAGDG